MIAVKPYNPYFLPRPPSTVYSSWAMPKTAPTNQGCCACHVTRAAIYVCLIEAVFVSAILAIFLQFFFARSDPTDSAPLTVAAICALIGGLAAVSLILCVLIGLCRRSARLLIPHLIGQIVGVCLMTGVGALILLMTFTGTEFDQSFGPDFGGVFLAIAVLCLGMALAEVWFFFLVRDCYFYLKDPSRGSEMGDENGIGHDPNSWAQDRCLPKPPEEPMKQMQAETAAIEQKGETEKAPEEKESGEKDKSETSGIEQKTNNTQEFSL